MGREYYYLEKEGPLYVTGIYNTHQNNPSFSHRINCTITQAAPLTVFVYINVGSHRISDQGPLAWRDLDGRELVFMNKQRPGRRYLYYYYVTTLLRIRGS